MFLSAGKLIFLSLFVSVAVMASNFQGTWTGAGSMDSSVEGHLTVDPVVFVFTANGATLSSRDCWTFNYGGNDWRYCSHRDLELKYEKVFFKDSLIGEYTENKISVHYFDGDAEVQATAEIQTDGTLNYSYSSVQASGRYLKQQAVGLRRQ